jgi:hypothetical protein
VATPDLRDLASGYGGASVSVWQNRKARDVLGPLDWSHSSCGRLAAKRLQRRLDKALELELALAVRSVERCIGRLSSA